MARRFRAPGRVNLIGEHTDYNLGFVLPMALDLACIVESRPSPDGLLRVRSESRNDEDVLPPSAFGAVVPPSKWSAYPFGIAWALVHAGYDIRPMQLSIGGTVPEGAGLSSSAALEVACALALLDGRPIDPLELAKLCLKAEREFVGLPCGIMDQYVAVFAQADAALRIDCRDLTHRTIPLPQGAEFLAVDTMVKHELAHSAYKERTEECAAAVREIQRRHPSVTSLRDIRMDQLEALLPQMPPVIARRAQHVVSENERVEDFCAACEANDLNWMGRLMVESHWSLRGRYEVSCDELDFLVSEATTLPGVYGARMTGGGFGGCTINLVAPAVVERFRAAIARAYEKAFGVTPQIYLCRPGAGAGELR
ncbi:MAG: galactokinase [Bryobacteraceae bacterium]